MTDKVLPGLEQCVPCNISVITWPLADNTTLRPAGPAVTARSLKSGVLGGMENVPVILPHCGTRKLGSQFLQSANTNTAWGTEACGILCGKVVKNEFTPTYVLTPRHNAECFFFFYYNTE